MLTVNCCNPESKEPISEQLFKIIVSRFDITGNDVAELRLLIDFYSDTKTMERVTEAFKPSKGSDNGN